jgi:hypothetical protein
MLKSYLFKKKLGLMRFQDTMILSKVTWNLYASWNNKSILKTKQKMALPRAPHTKMAFSSPLYNKGAFSRPGSPYTKMAFSRPPIQQN